MGCCYLVKKPKITHNNGDTMRKSIRKMDSVRSKVDEMRSEIFENTLYGNEDNYYDEEELKQIDRGSLLNLINTTVEDQKTFKWQLGQTIGQGSFGRVSQALNLETGQLMAIKQVLIGNNRDDERLAALEIEIELLSLLKHKNIVSYYGMERDKSSVNIFLEYVAGGSLSQMIQKFGVFNESIIKAYTKQILLGLEYLHSHGVMHRDIKGGNVLVDKNGVCKLADFGSSKKLQSIVGEGSLFGTPNFMAPEVVKQQKTGRKADIWSLGCTIIELSTGKPPWANMANQFAVMIRIGKGEVPVIPDSLSEDAKDFISHCLEVDQNKRWNAIKLLKHPFLINKNKLETPLMARTPLKGTPLKGTPGSRQKKKRFEYPGSQLLQPPSQIEGNDNNSEQKIPSTKVINVHHQLKPSEVNQEQLESQNDNEINEIGNYQEQIQDIQKSDFELDSIKSMPNNNKFLLHYLLSDNDNDNQNNDQIAISCRESSQIIQQKKRKQSPVSPHIWMQEC